MALRKCACSYGNPSGAMCAVHPKLRHVWKGKTDGLQFLSMPLAYRPNCGSHRWIGECGVLKVIVEERDFRWFTAAIDRNLDVHVLCTGYKNTPEVALTELAVMFTILLNDLERLATEARL